jgi:hypothetical protein
MERNSGDTQRKSASLPLQAATNAHKATTTTTATRPGARVTRGTSGAGKAQLTKSREELYKDSEVKWLDASTLNVKKHLYAKGFTADESSPLDDLEDLAMILLRIAADTNLVLTADACRMEESPELLVPGGCVICSGGRDAWSGYAAAACCGGRKRKSKILSDTD